MFQRCAQLDEIKNSLPSLLLVCSSPWILISCFRTKQKPQTPWIMQNDNKGCVNVGTYSRRRQFKKPIHGLLVASCCISLKPDLTRLNKVLSHEIIYESVREVVASLICTLGVSGSNTGRWPAYHRPTCLQLRRKCPVIGKKISASRISSQTSPLLNRPALCKATFIYKVPLQYNPLFTWMSDPILSIFRNVLTA